MSKLGITGSRLVARGSQLAKTPFWRGNPATATAKKDNRGYRGVITGGDQKRSGLKNRRMN